MLTKRPVPCDWVSCVHQKTHVPECPVPSKVTLLGNTVVEDVVSYDGVPLQLHALSPRFCPVEREIWTQTRKEGHVKMG